MSGRIDGIGDVAEKHLCCGCGACAYAQPEAIRMVDVLDQGRRPVVSKVAGVDASTKEALRVCPGVELTQRRDTQAGGFPQLARVWGPVLELWEGFAADPDIRFAGSSGGAATALALHCLENEGMHGVLHVAARTDVPYLNRTVLSRSREEMLQRTGSRYAPASPCDGLGLVEQAPGPCVFIGKPCDVAAVDKARRLRPELDRRVGFTVAFFCAGTPTTNGTLEMIGQMGIEDLDQVEHVRYRGNGWPGMAEVKVAIGERRETRQMTYEQSWGEILQRHRQWRCHVCPDHTGEFADVAVGDPWYRPIEPGEPGRSLVVVRTELGRQIVQAARELGTIVLEKVGPEVLPAAQSNLLHARGAVWGRVLSCRAMGVAAPDFRGMPLLSVWWHHLSARQKAQSIYGTVRRVVTKRLYTRRPAVPYEPQPNPSVAPSSDQTAGPAI